MAERQLIRNLALGQAKPQAPRQAAGTAMGGRLGRAKSKSAGFALGVSPE
jgi:hypothetical protein